MICFKVDNMKDNKGLDHDINRFQLSTRLHFNRIRCITELLGSNYLLQGRFISSFYLEWHLIYYYVNYLNLIQATIFPRQEYNGFQPIIWGRHRYSGGKSEYSWYYAIYLAFMYGTL